MKVKLSVLRSEIASNEDVLDVLYVILSSNWSILHHSVYCFMFCCGIYSMFCHLHKNLLSHLIAITFYQQNVQAHANWYKLEFA